MRQELDELNDSLGGFEFRVNPTTTKKEVSTDGGNTWENFSSGAELLWTNPAPTTHFGINTISLDLSNYECVLIDTVYHARYPNDHRMMQMIPKDNNGYVLGNASVAQGRGVIVNDSGVQFGDANSPNYCIPHKIYGWNGFSAFPTIN